jgi:hypothetical protein
MVPSPLAIIGTYVKFSKKLIHLHMLRGPSQLSPLQLITPP